MATNRSRMPGTKTHPFSKEQADLIQEMREMGSHTFYSQAFTERLEAAFGMRFGYYEQANAGDPKGLTVAGAGQNVRVYGSASHSVACLLCSKYGLEYQSAMGRGTLFWNAMDALTHCVKTVGVGA